MTQELSGENLDEISEAILDFSQQPCKHQKLSCKRLLKVINSMLFPCFREPTVGKNLSGNLYGMIF
jgi:hypothetical protein